MSLVRVLSLPVVKKLIGVYLGKGSLFQCIHVCQSWFEAFHPILWQDIQVGVNQVNGVRVGPPNDVLVQNNDLIKSLKVHSVDAQVLDVTFTRLTELETCIIQHTIALHCPWLVKLRIQGPCDYATDVAETFAWDAVSQLIYLRHLALEACYIGPHCVDEFWSACGRLESLEIFSVTIERTSNLINMTFPRLRKLYLKDVVGLTALDELYLITRCPKLMDLKWISNDRGWFPETSLFAECVAFGVWPSLKKLDIHGVILDEQMTMICKGMQKATKLVLASTVQTALLPTACNQLKRHFNSLVQLDLRRAGADSSTVCYILCSCPRLEVFAADKVLARHIADQLSWDCAMSLRVLALRLVFQKDEYTLQRLVFQKLSILHRLEELSDDNHEALDLDQARIGLDFRLMSGMGALATLKQMKVLRFGSTQRLDTDDAKWMLLHWKQLETICGEPSADHNANGTIKEILAAGGVRCTAPRTLANGEDIDL
ncbi:MAG: hypothetical protein J3Q66DRAFT_164854 [Benniella sp.]|nr:MAG: hypothetical protein J3Q66DRAFT_164854 [Benniella sp.]